MRKSIYNVCIAGAGLLLGLASCEMKDEILGDKTSSGETATVQLGVGVDAKVENAITKATTGDETTDALKVDIYDASNKKVKEFASVADMPETFPLDVAEGYKVEVYSPEERASVMTTPYFLGSATLDVVASTTNTANVTAKIQNIPVRINYDSKFLSDYSNWTISIAAGDNNLLTYTKADDGTTPAVKYWDLGDEGVETIEVSITAFKPDAPDTPITKTEKFKKINAAEDYAGDKDAFGPGDAITIIFEPLEPTTPDVEPAFQIGISVDVTFLPDPDDKDSNTTITVTPEGSTDPTPDPDPDQPTTPTDAITISDNGTGYLTNGVNVTGTDYPTDVAVKMDAVNKIQNVYVKIETNNSAFSAAAKLMADGALVSNTGLDLCSEAAKVLGEGDDKLFDLPTAGTDTYTFTMNSKLWNLLGMFSGTHKFILTVVDQADPANEKSATLQVTIPEKTQE